MKHLTNSSISTFRKCPRAYFYAYVHRLEDLIKAVGRETEGIDVTIP